MNSYFINVGQRLADGLPDTPLDVGLEASYSDSMFFMPTTESAIKQLINNVDTSKAVGEDGVDVLTLKRCCESVSRVLCKLVNQSMSSGKVPTKIKIAKVRPLYKDGDRDNVNNYRPISVLPTVSKIFEKVVNVRLKRYLYSHDYLYKFQYGFRESSDTASATIDLMSNIQIQVDQGKRAAMVSLDLRKAFDTVNHQILLRKLELLGIRGNCYSSFSDYLGDKRQFVTVSDVKSSSLNINCGVPQGSILGPTLFLVYVNSISNLNLKGQINLYADDTMLVYFGGKC